MPEPEELLKVGDRVINNVGQVGEIILAGPYDDAPYQVRLDDGEGHCDGVHSDGTVIRSEMVWEIVYV